MCSFCLAQGRRNSELPTTAKNAISFECLEAEAEEKMTLFIRRPFLVCHRHRRCFDTVPARSGSCEIAAEAGGAVAMVGNDARIVLEWISSFYFYFSFLF